MEIKTKFNIGDVVYFVTDNLIYEKLTEDPFMFNGKLFESIKESKVQSIVTKSFEHIRSSSINQSIDYYLKGKYLVDEKKFVFFKKRSRRLFEARTNETYWKFAK